MTDTTPPPPAGPDSTPPPAPAPTSGVAPAAAPSSQPQVQKVSTLAMAGFLAIVFTASFATMTLELVAGRVMAPYVGVSIFTWTSIIGVILLGISVGNYLGGIVADRFEPRSVLAMILLASGVFSLAILVLIEFVPGWVGGMPIIPRIVTMTALLFLPPALLLGMDSPVVIKMAIQDLRNTGSVAGKIYAFSTVGAIAGTFMTGFFFVSVFGTRLTILGVAVVLLGMGAAALYFAWRAGNRRTATRVAIAGGLLVVLAGAVGAASVQRQGLLSGCDIESNYFCIKVYDQQVGGRTVRTLVLDHLIHSYTEPNDPTFVYYDYLQNYADLTEHLRVTNGRDNLRFLFLGGGGYTLPRYFEHVYPESHTEVIEVDPGVVEANYSLIGLPRDTGIISYAMDARMGIYESEAGRGGEQYDVIFGDAFNDVSVPYHLATKEFAEELRSLLKPDGYYAALVIDNMATGRFIVSYARTLQEVFPYVTVMATKGQNWNRGLGTYLIVAGNQPLNTAAAEQAIRPGATRSVTGFMPPEVFAEWITKNDPLILTDDFAPVDNLLAPQVIARN